LSIFFNGTNSPKPERSKSAEAGVKFGLTEIGLSGTLAVYQSTRTNVPTPDPTTFFTSIQTGEQRARGAELDLIYEPRPSLSLLASYAYTDAEVRRDTVVPAGSALPRVPENRGSLETPYRFLDGALSGLEFGAGVTAASAAVMTLPNGLKSDSYAVFDAQASYDLRRVRLGLRIDNLFGSDYFVPYQYFAQDVVRPGNRRSAFVSVGFEF
jgi:iron complex outermembrane receptor protein